MKVHADTNTHSITHAYIFNQSSLDQNEKKTKIIKSKHIHTPLMLSFLTKRKETMRISILKKNSQVVTANKLRLECLLEKVALKSKGNV